MAGKERMRLTDSAIARLRPREREYTVWDSKVAGLGVRVRPSGGRSYVMLQDTDGRSNRASLGPVSLKKIDAVRRECHARRAAREAGGTIAPARAIPSFREFVEGEWKQACFDRYKPSTQKGARTMLAVQLLPTFGSKPLDRIAPAQVRSWFDAYSRTAPGGANRTLDILRQIMNFAIGRGHIDRNPVQVVKKNRRQALTRFLSREEIGRLHAALDSHAGEGEMQQADIVRLLLLTGCRRSEIVQLRWSEVRGDVLALADSKTGPKKVPLGTQARRILERQPRSGSAFVFPSPRDPARPRGVHLALWDRVRREAGIEDCRLHDLRHTFASQAVMSGVPVPVVSRMLGHSNVRMTLRYAHLGDREIEQAAERVGSAIATLMGPGTQRHPIDTSSGGSPG